MITLNNEDAGIVKVILKTIGQDDELEDQFCKAVNVTSEELNGLFLTITEQLEKQFRNN